MLNGTEGFVPTLLHVYVRFGRWDEVLAYPVRACVRACAVADDEHACVD
eukprot:COSAG01_NODE_1647_length_9631_cov_82.855644_13_plen_49_part_00